MCWWFASQYGMHIKAFDGGGFGRRPGDRRLVSAFVPQVVKPLRSSALVADGDTRGCGGSRHKTTGASDTQKYRRGWGRRGVGGGGGRGERGVGKPQDFAKIVRITHTCIHTRHSLTLLGCPFVP